MLVRGASSWLSSARAGVIIMTTFASRAASRCRRWIPLICVRIQRIHSSVDYLSPLQKHNHHVYLTKIQVADAHHCLATDSLRARPGTYRGTFAIGILSLPDETQGREQASWIGRLGDWQGRQRLGTVWESSGEFMEGLSEPLSRGLVWMLIVHVGAFAT